MSHDAPDIEFGTYDRPDADDKRPSRITLGVFFDGTLNNRWNTYIRKEKEKKKKGRPYDQNAVDDDPWGVDKDSYDNDYSNIARKANYYSEGEENTVYVEGPGTEDGKTDTVAGYVSGTGATGVRMKVRAACERIAGKIPKDCSLTLTLDLFGFSRGAAGARNFIHEITKGPYKADPSRDARGNTCYKDSFGERTGKKDLPSFGHLGSLLKDKNVTLDYFSIRFVGLYDTVSSYGINFEDDVSDLSLDSLSHWRVKNVVQLAASDEWRKNFNRTDITSAGEKGREYLLPGAHADVGGCYEDGTFTQKHTYFQDWHEASGAEAERKRLIDQGWYLEEELVVKSNPLSSPPYYELHGKRKIDKRYSYITLNFMCRLAIEKGVEFNMDGIKDSFPIPTKTFKGNPHILDYVKQKLEEYIRAVKKTDAAKGKNISYQDYLDFKNEMVIRNGYVHWSATGKTGHEPRKGNKRKVITG